MRNWLVMAVVAMILNACSSTGDACGPVSGTINGCSNGTAPNTTASFARDFTKATYNTNNTADTSDDTLTFVGGDYDGANNYIRDASRDRAGMVAFRNEFNSQGVDYYALYGTSRSGDIKVMLSATGNYADEGDYFAGYERVASTALPTRGNATYEGKYAGAVVNTKTSGITLTDGTVRMTVEFDENSRIDGYVTIANRNVISGTAPTLTTSRIIFTEASIDASTGAFTGGTATAYDAAGTVIGTGNYLGVIGGSNGSEIGGALDVTTGNNREFGVFVGDCIPGTGLTCIP